MTTLNISLHLLPKKSMSLSPDQRQSRFAVLIYGPRGGKPQSQGICSCMWILFVVLTLWECLLVGIQLAVFTTSLGNKIADSHLSNTETFGFSSRSILDIPQYCVWHILLSKLLAGLWKLSSLHYSIWLFVHNYLWLPSTPIHYWNTVFDGTL